jgi:hypothetical protein
VFLSTPIDPEIRQLDPNGKLTRFIRFPHPPLATSAEAKQAYRAFYLSAPGENGRPMSPAMQARMSEMIDRTVFIDQLPPFAAMLVDRTGHLWVQRYDYHSDLRTPGPARTQTMPVPSRWNVIDPNGQWLCIVELPARFTPVEIGTDYIAGLGRDIDDVEQVRVYRLRKP